MTMRFFTSLISISFIVAISACGSSSGGFSSSGSSSSSNSSSSSSGSSSGWAFGTLNDTGVTTCADAYHSLLPCPVDGFPGQDGEHGRDADSQLIKMGGGAAGFDFSKLAGDGLPLPIQDQPWTEGGTETAGTHWSCVEDHVTGLIWEVKERDQTHPRYALSTYSWYNSDATTNGGDTGIADGGTCHQLSCDTETYVHYLNSIALCGFDDWRLPNVKELISIGHMGESLPAIDRDYFPNTLQPLFWSSDSHASNPLNAWYVYFSDISVSSTLKSNTTHLRLVRGGPYPPAIEDHFDLSDPGLVRDTATGLVWQRCTLGQSWQDGNCVGDSQWMSWQDALIHAAGANDYGQQDWRLPNKSELESILRRTSANPAIDAQLFPGTESRNYWTSTPVRIIEEFAWAVDFFTGFHLTTDKQNLLSVRLVREE